MKIITAILISAVLVAGGSVAGAEMFSGFSGVGSSLKYFDLQKELTASDIPVGELQKEMVREVPAGFVPSRQDKRPWSPKSGDSAPVNRNAADLI